MSSFRESFVATGDGSEIHSETVEEIPLRMEGVYRRYDSEGGAIDALADISLSVARGSFVVLMGPSGSGKSTFLHCASGVDRPTDGEIWLGGVPLSGMGENDLTRLRRERVGFVFQAYNLLPALDVQDNVTLPLRLAGAPLDRDWADRILERVGIADRLGHRPAELSGGQQQRVAIARALIGRPDLILADEPTGALDSDTGGRVLRLLRESVDDLDQTVLMVTHDPVAASYADTALFLADGRIVDSLDGPTAPTVAERMSRLGRG